VKSPGGTFIIKGDISACNRSVEGATGFSDSFHGLLKLKKAFRFQRAAKVEIVCYGEGFSPGTG
jgi:hypothetical protein